MKELRPCSYCDPKTRPVPWLLEVVRDNHMETYVLCGCGARGPIAPTIAEAIAAWNQRPGETELIEAATVLADVPAFVSELLNTLARTGWTAEWKTLERFAIMENKIKKAAATVERFKEGV